MTACPIRMRTTRTIGLLAFISVSLLQSISVPDYAHFIDHHLLPQGPIREILDKTFRAHKNPYIALQLAGCEFLRRKGKIVAIHPQISDYLIKSINYSHETIFDKVIRTFNRNRNIYRVAVNDAIKQCIYVYNLQHITTPKKYLYRIPNSSHDFSDASYIVLSEKMPILCKKCNQHYFQFHATDEEKKEIETVIRTIGYGDSHLENICILKTGKVAIIDTEPHGSVDMFRFLPGFDRAVHALSSKVGQDIFHHECRKRSKKKDTTRSLEVSCTSLETCLKMCPDCTLDRPIPELSLASTSTRHVQG